MTTERTQQHQYELNTESRLTKLESTNDAILNTLIDINHKIDKLDNKIDKLDNRMWSLYSSTVAGFVGILAVIAHGFHWI